jgi:hypothetical protein
LALRRAGVILKDGVVRGGRAVRGEIDLVTFMIIFNYIDFKLRCGERRGAVP